MIATVLVAVAGDVVPLVTHGAPDSAHPAVVAIVDSSGQTTCSGTLVDPHFVLTAAHCVEPQTAHGARVVAGASLAAQTGSAPVAALRQHPAYDAATYANDAAVVVLGQALSVAPAVLGVHAPAVDATVLVVGWGESADDAGDYGVKRAGTALVTDVGDLSFAVGPDPSQPCVGDSGGAAFAETAAGEFLVGVTSHGDATCSNHATYTRVDAVAADFVRSTLAALGPGTVAPGARCLYAEQCSGGAGACLSAPDQPGLGYCTESCAHDADCPAGMVCGAVSVDASECLYPVPTPGAFGGSCRADADCFDGVCVAGACTVRCTPTADSGCPAGSTCQDQGDGIDFTCVLDAPVAPTGGCAVTADAPASDRAALVLELAGLLGVALLRLRRSP